MKIIHEGTYKIYINGKLDKTVYNTVMNTVLMKIATIFAGTAPDLQIKYLALGTSSTAVTTADTKLGVEIFRTAVAAQSMTGTGEETTEFTVLDSESVATIEEIGIFAGAAATAAANSGTLVSRILWHKVKTISEELTIKRVDKILRG